MNFTTLIQGNWAIGGAPQSEYNGSHDAGKVFLFRKEGNDWSFNAFLYPEKCGGDHHFGNHIVFHNDCLLISADNAQTPGRAVLYVYHFNGQFWTKTSRITDTDPTLPLELQYMGVHHKQIPEEQQKAVGKEAMARKPLFHKFMTFFQRPLPMAFRF
jgi:hypothetical protein